MKTISVRKYQNRKLYAQERTSYVSMLELSNIVAEGERVIVTCDLTGRDITLETLARALYERAKVTDKDQVDKSVVEKLERLIVAMPIKKELA